MIQIFFSIFCKLVSLFTDRQQNLSCDAEERIFEGHIAAHSIPNLFYILRKQFDIPKRKKLLRSLCEIFNVVEIDKANICAALDNDNWKDFEDCLQYQCACSADVDYIITRNPKDYVGSEISLLTAEEFLDLAK